MPKDNRLAKTEPVGEEIKSAMTIEARSPAVKTNSPKMPLFVPTQMPRNAKAMKTMSIQLNFIMISPIFDKRIKEGYQKDL